MNDENKSLDGMSGDTMPKDDQFKPAGQTISVKTADENTPASPQPAPGGVVTPRTETESDPNSPTTTPTEEKKPEPEKKPEDKKKKSKLPLVLLCILLFALGAAAATYFFRQSQIDSLNNEINSLKSQNATLQAENDALKSAQPEDDSSDSSTPPAEQPVDLSALILKSVSDGTYSNLQPYMADSVTVTIGASDGLGVRTPTQAVQDLKYLDAGTDPWNFALPAATLQSWRTGDYASYFPTSAEVGQSANKYVVSFMFDSNGDIAAIFMIANADLLAPAS